MTVTHESPRSSQACGNIYTKTEIQKTNACMAPTKTANDNKPPEGKTIDESRPPLSSTWHVVPYHNLQVLLFQIRHRDAVTNEHHIRQLVERSTKHELATDLALRWGPKQGLRHEAYDCRKPVSCLTIRTVWVRNINLVFHRHQTKLPVHHTTGKCGSRERRQLQMTDSLRSPFLKYLLPNTLG